MDANVGMLDALASAEWTAKYIERFGGNASQFSVIGESAGAGMLYYLTTLRDGEAPLPFQQAFIASPAAPPRRDIESRQTSIFKTVLETAKCASINCLRYITETELKAVNHFLINNTNAGVVAETLDLVLDLHPRLMGSNLLIYRPSSCLTAR